MSAVEPVEFKELTVAPAAKRSCMMAVFPLWAAAEMGATPLRLSWLGSAPASSSCSTADTF